jgi:uncharacterized membrane protein
VLQCRRWSLCWPLRAWSYNAPVEHVYAFWTLYENFPRFMEHVREVRKGADDQSHWVVSGPAGVSVTFDVMVTKRVPNQVVAWKTLPGSPIQHAGIVHFMRNGQGGTTVDIKMSYNPVIGGLGHSIATLLGADPKHVLDDDLVRFKSLIEEGKTTAHHEKETLEEVATEPTERASAPAARGRH